MFRTIIRRLVANSFITQQFVNQFKISDSPLIIIVAYCNYIERYIIDFLIESYSKYQIITNRDIVDIRENQLYIINSGNLDSIKSLKNRTDITFMSFFICWKRRTRYKKSIVRDSTLNIFKIKRLFFDKKDIFFSITQHHFPQNKLELDDLFEEIYYSLNGSILLTKKMIQKSILSHEKVRSHIESKKSAGKKILRFITEIHTRKQISSVQWVRRILDIVWHFTLEGIVVDQKGIERVREISKKHQIVYVPSHRSHADYLMIGNILYKYGLDTPLTVAGINLAFFPIGKLFRRIGAYFIRRSFAREPTYSLTFRIYLRMLMKTRNSQMFYIEGGRSRAGKLLEPKFGMLSMLVDCVKCGDIDDFYFVPLSVEYGKLFEGQSYKEELTGSEKKKENIFAMFDMLKYFKRRQGITYIQFAEPFSVAEYFGKLTISDLTVRDYNRSVRKLGYLITHRINSVVTVTPSAIISLILLSNPQRGIPHNELFRSCKLIYHYLKTKNVRLALDENKFETAFSSVLSNFEYNNYISHVRYLDNSIYNIQEGSRLYLDYYKNNIIHLFLPLAFIATILRAYEGKKLQFSVLYDKIDQLKDIFKHEFVFNDSTWDTKILLETFKFFSLVKEVKINAEFLTKLGTKYHWLNITHHIIRNFLEGYYITTIRLQEIKGICSQETFFSDLSSFSLQMLEAGQIEMLESNSKDIYKNVLAYCSDNKWISTRGKNIQLIQANRDKFNDFIGTLKYYLV